MIATNTKGQVPPSSAIIRELVITPTSWIIYEEYQLHVTL
jgi:hypothetical protein